MAERTSVDDSEKILKLLDLHKDSLCEKATLSLRLAAAHVRRCLKQKEVDVERNRIQSFELALAKRLDELDGIQREIDELEKRVGCDVLE